MAEVVKEKEVHRLSQEVYKDLEKKIGHIQVEDSTSELSAGFQLGVQKVLALLRNGFVV